jgi:hypothetical protein
MTYSQKYAIVQFFEPVGEHAQFSMDNWPLHTTLADVFSADLTEIALGRLTAFLSSQHPVSTAAKGDATLGSADHPTHVTLIENSPALQSLHDGLVDALAESGAVFNSPQYTHDGFLPHCTIQPTARIHAGDAIVIDRLSIIDMFVGGDWRQRSIIKNIALGDQA